MQGCCFLLTALESEGLINMLFVAQFDGLCCLSTVHVEPELLHTYSKYYKYDVLLLIVRLAVLTAVTLTVPVVLFPVSYKYSTVIKKTSQCKLHVL